EDVRELLDKAPDEYRHRFDEVLAGYNGVCADERERVIAAGGLHILGTERHESRRIDNQLRGRAGRQGDPGSSRFYLSLEDDLMRIFGADRIQGIMSRLGMEEGVPIEHGLVTRAIENAQKKVEAHNFDIRKHLLEYDDVLNKQREVIYNQRREVLKGEALKEDVLEMARELNGELVARFAEKDVHPSEWDLNSLREGLYHQFNTRFDLKPEEEENLTAEDLMELVDQRVNEAYEDKEKRFGAPMLRQLEKIIMLQTIDTLWKDHLLNMDHLKEGIGLRGYGQRDPLTEYKKEAFDMFQEMMDHLEEVVLEQLFKVRIGNPELAPAPVAAPAAHQPAWREIHGTNGDTAPSEPRMIAEQKSGAMTGVPAGRVKSTRSAASSREPDPEPIQYLVPCRPLNPLLWGFFLVPRGRAVLSVSAGFRQRMRLELIVIQGFKSFAEKTEIKIFPGVTCVVGPNGCGKSNVADAVRWALGEQSPKILRGQKMEDVIFHGSSSRKAVGLAEVSLVFNNDGALDVPWSEVGVARRLYRTGESEYVLNKNICRLRDVQDLFARTGVNPKAYTLTDQD